MNKLCLFGHTSNVHGKVQVIYNLFEKKVDINLSVSSESLWSLDRILEISELINLMLQGAE